MRGIHKFLVTSALCAIGTAGHAQSIECGANYTVSPGDSLSAIAQRAYGSTSSFTLIFNANTRVIGSDPSVIVVGQTLTIPCLNAPVEDSVADASAISTRTTEVIPAPAPVRPIRVLTATGWPPFLDEDQEQGGLLTEIINLALANADGEPEYQIDFINDAGAHLQPLVSQHAYDISIGWSQPDCSDMSMLADESQFRCNNLDFSDAMYEEIFGYYTSADDPVLATHDELRGRSICRAEGFSLLPLETVGLSEPDITVIRAPDAPSCIDYLVEGRADVALVAVDVAEGRMVALNVADTIQFQENLTYVDVLHAVISKTNPKNEEILAAINSGLANIKESGVWFETVRRHMTAYREQNPNG